MKNLFTSNIFKSLQNNSARSLLLSFESFRQQQLQFRPPFEEIKAKYFREMKRFISIPNNFKGVGDDTNNLIFPAIIDRNAEGFITCYRKADALFKRLETAQHQFKVGKKSQQQIKVHVYTKSKQQFKVDQIILAFWWIIMSQE